MRSLSLLKAVLAVALLASWLPVSAAAQPDEDTRQRLHEVERRLAELQADITQIRSELIEIVAHVGIDENDHVPAWTLRSRHFIYGMPEVVDLRHNFIPANHTQKQPGISVLVREGFVVGHVDRFKTPLWVSMKWTRDDLERSMAIEAMPRNFRPDPELPAYAQASPEYRGSVTGYDRGHMARHADNRAWGRRNSDAGNFMSNIAPQSIVLNRRSWLSIENAHRNVVSETVHPDIDTVWIISGCVYEDDTPVEFIANDVAVPQATFKVIAWFDGDNEFHARGYVVPQEASEPDPSLYLTPIRDIEHLTGLNFFPELDREEQDRIETAVHDTIWHQ